MVILTESWLNSTVFDREVFDDRYNIFRRDRSSTLFANRRDGGGIIIASLKKHNVLRKPSWESRYEDMWLTFKLGTARKPFQLTICTTYIPPPIGLEVIDASLTKFTQIYNTSCTNQNSLTLFIGDFNLANVVWDYDSVTKTCTPRPCQGARAVENRFLDEIELNNLHQCNYIANSKNHILDLVMTNSPNSVNVREASVPLIHLDLHHPALEIQVIQPKINNMLRGNRSPRLDFHRSDFDKINQELKDVNWSSIWLECRDVDQMVTNLYETIFCIIGKHTPCRKPRNNRFPVWFSRPLIKCSREKAKYHNRYKKYGNKMDWVTYEELRIRCDRMIRECLKRFKTNASETLRSNPKHFWSYVNGLKSNSSSLPNQMYLGDTIATGGQHVYICNLFSSHFLSVYSASPPFGNTPQCSRAVENLNSLVLSSIELSEKEIYQSLIQLDSNKGAGPDGIPPLFLKKCAKYLAEPLTYIYNKSLCLGCFPAKWKKARVTPVHKKDDHAAISNYRPVSILSSF